MIRNKTRKKSEELIENEQVDLYSKNTPRWILKENDTLIWSGIGGEVELGLKETYNACILAKRILEEKKRIEEKKA